MLVLLDERCQGRQWLMGASQIDYWSLLKIPRLGVSLVVEAVVLEQLSCEKKKKVIVLFSWNFRVLSFFPKLQAGLVTVSRNSRTKCQGSQQLKTCRHSLNPAESGEGLAVPIGSSKLLLCSWQPSFTCWPFLCLF